MRTSGVHAGLAVGDREGPAVLGLELGELVDSTAPATGAQKPQCALTADFFEYVALAGPV